MTIDITGMSNILWSNRILVWRYSNITIACICTYRTDIIIIVLRCAGFVVTVKFCRMWCCRRRRVGSTEIFVFVVNAQISLVYKLFAIKTEILNLIVELLSSDVEIEAVEYLYSGNLRESKWRCLKLHVNVNCLCFFVGCPTFSLTGQMGDVGVHHVDAEGRHCQQHNTVCYCEVCHFDNTLCDVI